MHGGYKSGTFGLSLLGCLLLAVMAQAADISLSVQRPGQQFQFVNITGQIVPGDETNLEKAIEQATGKGQLAVMLDSMGGDVDVSMVLGQQIRAARGVTFHRYCASACVYTFLGGVTRYMSVKGEAVLRVHRPELAEMYFSNPSPPIQKKLDELRHYIEAMTGSSDFYTIMIAIPFGAPQPLSQADALSSHAVTGILP